MAIKKVKVKKEWSPHKYLVAAARKTWRWSPARTAVLARVKVDTNHWKCEKCSTVVSQINVITKRGRKRKKIDGAVDHIVPVGKQPREWAEYPDYYKRMYCDITNLQFLCTACHAPKSKTENAKRRKTK